MSKTRIILTFVLSCIISAILFVAWDNYFDTDDSAPPPVAERTDRTLRS